MRKTINTVLGPISPEALGQTLVHEHITCADWSMRMNFGDRFYQQEKMVEMASGQLRKVKELVASGVLGDIRLVTIKLYQSLRPEQYKNELPWRVQPKVSGGGLFHDLAPHQLDILDFILGPIAAASGQVTNQAGMYEAEDLVTAQFRFESGVLGSGVWCFSVAEQQQQDSIEIIGSKGRLTFPTFAKVPIRLETATGTEEFLLPPPQHVQQPFIQSIVEELTGKGKCPGSAVSAARTSWVMDQIVGRG